MKKTVKKSSVSKKVEPVKVIIAVAIALLVFVGLNYWNSDKDDSVEKILTTETDWRQYSSVKYNFKIDFPGFPTASETVEDFGGLSIPTTQYTRANGDQEFFVQVSSFPDELDLSDTLSILEDSLNGSVQASDSRLVESNFLDFKGFRAIEGVLEYSDEKSQSQRMHELVFFDGNNQYVMIATKVSQDDYRRFVDSFVIDTVRSNDGV
jgi:hypothetical protein